MVERSWPELTTRLHDAIPESVRTGGPGLDAWLDTFPRVRHDSDLLEAVLFEIERQRRQASGRPLLRHVMDFPKFQTWTKGAIDTLVRLVAGPADDCKDRLLDLIRHALEHGEGMRDEEHAALALAYLDLAGC